jgi:hypothetical protein
MRNLTRWFPRFMYAHETGRLFMWLGWRCWSFNLNGPGESFTGAGKWAW